MAQGLDLFGRVSTVDTGERSAHDFYETPKHMTLSLLHHHRAIKGASVLEPASGRDAIAAVLREYGCAVFTNDIDPRHPAQMHFDARTFAFWDQAPKVEWIVTNLPFNEAFPILRLSLLHADVGVAMLLRKTFLEPTDDRGPWLATHPPSRVIGLPRHSFRGSGSDSVSTDWMIWERRPDRTLRPFEIDHLADKRRTS